MFNTEFNLKDALAVRYEEGIEKGEARGIVKGEARGIAKGEAIGIVKGEAKGMKKLLALWEKGIPLAEAKRRLGV